MKCVIVFVSCVLAVASAGYGATSYAYQNNGAYPAASHAVAYNAPVVHGGYGHAGSGYGYAQAAPIAHGYAHRYAHGGYYGGELRIVDPVAIAAGAPLPVGDTHEVAIAKAAHFKAHAIAKSRLPVAPIAHGYAHATPVAHEYAHGYAHAAPAAYGYAHAAPVVHGYAHAAPLAHGYAHGTSVTRLVDPVAIAAGAPLPGGDTYEVAAAKTAHLQAHAAAKNGHLGLY